MARSSNRKRYFFYGILMLAIMGTIFYLLFINEKNKLEKGERENLEQVKIDMIERTDSLESIINTLIKENNDLIGKIEMQNKRLEESASNSTSTRPSSVTQIDLQADKVATKAILSKYDRQKGSDQFSFQVYLNNPKQHNLILKDLDRILPDAKASIYDGKLFFKPYQKSEFEIYYAKDADLNTATKVQMGLRKKKERAVIYKVRQTNPDNSVILVH